MNHYPASFLDAKAVTPHDTDLAVSGVPHVDALWVGGAGNLSIITAGGTTVTLLAVPAGTLVPIKARTVRSTLTTATSILGLIR